MTPDERNKKTNSRKLFISLSIASRALNWDSKFMNKYGARCWERQYIDGLSPAELADQIVIHANSAAGKEYYADPDGCSC